MPVSRIGTGDLLSITVTVAGVDRSAFVSEVNPASWDDTLNGRGTGSITFNVPFSQLASFRPTDGQTILVEEDLGGGPQPRFGGFLVEPESNELPDEGYVIFSCGMQDNNAIADRRIITAAYDEVALEDIVSDILSNSNSDGLTGEFITSGGVAAGAALSIDFPTLYVTEAFNDLAVKAGGYWWDIDDSKDLTFAPRTAVPAPGDLTNANVLKKTVRVRPVKEKYRNVEIVLAGKDDFPIVAMFEDAVEITARGTLEGTSGRYEHIEERQDILDSVLAGELAEDLVERFGEVTLLFECVTRDPGYASGQEVDVTFPNLELTAEAFLIDSVSARIVYSDEDGVEPEIWYSIRAITGDPFGGWMEHFRKRPGSSQERDIVPEPGVTIECDPGVVVHDPPPGPIEWFQGPASGTLNFTPTVIGITHEEAGQGGHYISVRRGPSAVPRQSIVELYPIGADESVDTTPSDTFTWDELVSSSFRSDMVVKPDGTKIAVVERDPGSDPIFIVVDIETLGKQGHVTAVGLSDVNTGFEAAWVGDHVYIPENGTGSVFVFDVSDPEAPTLVEEFSTSLGDATSVVADSTGTYLYVCGISSNDMAALDISDPTNISEVDTVALTGNYASIDINDDDILCAFERAGAADVRYLILPTTVGGGGSTFGTAIEDTVTLATAAMNGHTVVFDGPTAHVFASKPATSPSNSQRSYTFELNDPGTAFSLVETFSYNHSTGGNQGPARSTIGRRVIQVFGFNTDAQITYGVQTYPTCVDLETQWPLDADFGGTGHKKYVKGDILVATGPTTLIRLPLGLDDYYLRIDLDEDSGLSWQLVTGTDVVLARIGDSTFSSVQHLQDIFHSSGWVSGGTINDAGSGNITVDAGTGLIRATDSRTAEIAYFDWPALGSTAISGARKFVGVEYNGGDPQVVVRSAYDWDFQTDFPLGTVYNEGGTLHINRANQAVGDHASFMIQRLWDTMPLSRGERTGGLMLGETGMRNPTLSEGVLWERLAPYAIAAIDTSGADTFDTYYRDALGAWVVSAGETQWPNTQYDDGSGTLVTMTNNRFANLWFYVELDGDLVMLYGQGEYTQASSAQEEGPPTSIPPRLEVHGRLVGRLTFQKSAGAATAIASAFAQVFAAASITDHGDLAGLTDDDHPQYYPADGSRPLTGTLDMGAAGFDNAPAVRGSIDGLTTQLAADASHDVQVNPGSCWDSLVGNDRSIELPAAIVKQIDAAWTEGTNAGGMATGSVANDTLYYVILIDEDAGTGVDVMFDVSASGANAPTGWTARRVIWHVITDGSADILDYRQTGDRCVLGVPPLDVNDTTGTLFVHGTGTLTAPPGVLAFITAQFVADGCTSLAGKLRATGSADSGNDCFLQDSAGDATRALGGYFEIALDASSQMQYSLGASGGSAAWAQVAIWTRGWNDPRGRNV